MHPSEYSVTIHCDGASSNSIDRLSILLQQFAQAEELSVRIAVHQNPYLTLRTNGRVYRFRSEDLRSLTSDGHYCICHMMSGDIRLRISYGGAVSQLQAADPDHYMVVNRGVLLNRRHIIDHTRDAFVLDDGTSYTVRRTDRARLFHEFDAEFVTRAERRKGSV